VDTVVLDKTGTLTTGKPGITDVFGEDSERLMKIAAALESRSEHPFAKAILERAKGMDIPQVQDFQTLPGRGVAGKVEGMLCLGGNRRLMEEHGIHVPEYPQLAQQGKTPLYFAVDGTYLGAVAAADQLKPDSADAVAAMKKLRLQVIMLTGDNWQTANAIAQKAGVTQVIADVLPADKAGAVKDLQAQGHRVLMVGDGINDAPALAAADVGMAIGAGTDIAMDSAQIVLMTGSLSGVTGAVELSRHTIRNIKQNLFWAFFYNALCIPIAAGALYPIFGWQLSPMLGAAAMSLRSVFVVSNALRLRLFHPKTIAEHKAVEQIIPIKEEEKMETIIKVNGMMCPHCKAMVEKVCKAIPGTEDAVVDLTAKNVTVTGNPDVEAMKKAITEAGYEVVG
jgi:Cu+-exporting ATPase